MNREIGEGSREPKIREPHANYVEPRYTSKRRRIGTILELTVRPDYTGELRPVQDTASSLHLHFLCFLSFLLYRDRDCDETALNSKALRIEHRFTNADTNVNANNALQPCERHFEPVRKGHLHHRRFVYPIHLAPSHLLTFSLPPGTSGIGRAAVLALASHKPSCIYFTGHRPSALRTLKDHK